MTQTATVVVAHPSADLYGSDRQLLESVRALIGSGYDVHVVLPADGPLRPLLEQAGAQPRLLGSPVLRKSVATTRGVAGLAARTPGAVIAGARLLRELHADALYVNTVTLPTWLLAGRAARVPTLCHVHEAESDRPAVVRAALAAPLLAARRIVTNSRAARAALVDALPGLRRRTVVIYNGVEGPPAVAEPPRHRTAGSPARVALVARLSPRKGIDVALDAVARVNRDGHHLDLVVCGTVFPGYESYEATLRARAARPDLADHVEFRGYVHPTWPVLAAADVVLVPSRAEPFGNTAVEAMLARRPVIASAVEGLHEVIDDGRTGLLVPPDDPARLAEAIAGVLADPERAQRLATAGWEEALARFSVHRYRRDITQEVAALVALSSRRYSS